MSTNGSQIESFELEPGRVLAGKYVVEQRLGSGWEGEVYRIMEEKTGVRRAAKLFFPHRDQSDKKVRWYANKLDRLHRCSILVRYIHSEQVRVRGERVTMLISELVEGELLESFISKQRGKRLRSYEAMHVLYALACGLEQIHAMGEYHGDVHTGNILIARRGIVFDAKLIDLYHWGRATSETTAHDVILLIHAFHEMLGGRRTYASHPKHIKDICRGLRRDLIRKRFPTAGRLRTHLETFEWE